MKIWILFPLLISLGACSGTREKNQNAEQIPEAMECPASLDRSQGCPSPSSPAVTLGQKAPRQAGGEPKARKLRSIEGRCELWVEREKSARSCDQVKLAVRSTHKGEMREGVVQGFGVVFSDLNEDSYQLLANSTEYQLSTDKGLLEPGQKVVIRIKAKPLSR